MDARVSKPRTADAMYLSARDGRRLPCRWGSNMGYIAHSTAVVDEGAEIGDGTRIWHWVHVCGRRADRTQMLARAECLRRERVRIGDNVKIQNNVSVYDKVTLEDDVFCGPVWCLPMFSIHAPLSRARMSTGTPCEARRNAWRQCTVVCGMTIGSMPLWEPARWLQGRAGLCTRGQAYRLGRSAG